MAHQEGWIELYTLLEKGSTLDSTLVEKCKTSRTGLGETMLHWYSIEGAPDILQKIVDLGFDVNVQNDFGNTPIMECSQIERWDNARVLIRNGADLKIENEDGLDYFEYLSEYDVDAPEWIKRDA